MLRRSYAPGWRQHYYARTLLRMGLLRQYTDAPLGLTVSRTVFVCKGNIARSAYAAERARQLGFHNATSAGLCARDGKPADPRAVRLAAERGVDLGTHRARHAEQLRLGRDDDVFTFELWQARTLALDYGVRPRLLGAWAEPPRPHIEDPYQHADAYYASCFDVIDSALAQLALLLAPAPAAAEQAATGVTRL